MGSIGYALCTALEIDPRSTRPKEQAITALFQNGYTGHPVKDRMLSKIYELGVTLRVEPRILSTQDIKQVLIRTLRVRGLPADPRALTLIIKGVPVDPVDKLTLAIFGVY